MNGLGLVASSLAGGFKGVAEGHKNVLEYAVQKELAEAKALREESLAELQHRYRMTEAGKTSELAGEREMALQKLEGQQTRAQNQQKFRLDTALEKIKQANKKEEFKIFEIKNDMQQTTSFQAISTTDPNKIITIPITSLSEEQKTELGGMEGREVGGNFLSNWFKKTFGKEEQPGEPTGLVPATVADAPKAREDDGVDDFNKLFQSKLKAKKGDETTTTKEPVAPPREVPKGLTGVTGIWEKKKPEAPKPQPVKKETPDFETGSPHRLFLDKASEFFDKYKGAMQEKDRRRAEQAVAGMMEKVSKGYGLSKADLTMLESLGINPSSFEKLAQK